MIALYDIPPTANDPLFAFDLSQPVNNQTAIIDGVEVAWQHFFGDSGFGFQANATFVNGDVAYDLRAASGNPAVRAARTVGLRERRADVREARFVGACGVQLA